MTVPAGRENLPPDKEAAEDRVVDLLVSHVRSHGLSAEVIERPDRLTSNERRFPDVTTDALIEIAGNTWSVDVQVLAAPESHHIVPNGLYDRLTPLAERHRLIIEIEGDSPALPRLARIQRDVQSAINRSPASGDCETSGLSVTWRQADEQNPDVRLRALWLEAPSSKISDQVAATLLSPLLKKAMEQAQAPRKAGCLSAVVLDSVGHAKIAQGTHFLWQFPFTIQEAVDDVLRDVDHNLDAVLLLDREDVWHLMMGSFPTLSVDSVD